VSAQVDHELTRLRKRSEQLHKQSEQQDEDLERLYARLDRTHIRAGQLKLASERVSKQTGHATTRVS